MCTYRGLTAKKRQLQFTYFDERKNAFDFFLLMQKVKMTCTFEGLTIIEGV